LAILLDDTVMTLKTIQARSNPDLLKQMQVAIVVAEFNRNITEKLLEGALARLAANGIPMAHIQVVWVPGAIEIPLLVKLLAEQQLAHAIIALGAVIRGDTSHYDYVCQQVSEGCQQVMMAYDLPVIFGVLTTEDEVQAYARVGGEHGHKGEDAADAAIAMVSILNQLLDDQ
jgi:6,7-dimethyl-8-ribityllumazine synthase